MQTKRTKMRLASMVTVALLALAVVPVLAGSASAAAVGPAATPAVGTSTEWAFGGQAWVSGGIVAGSTSLTWNASAGAVVIYTSSSTGPTTTELTAQRTVAVMVTASYSAPGESWKYDLKAVETDHAYANLTNASSVLLANLTTVPAVGLMNASFHANASLQASLVGKVGTAGMSDYLNVSGWADGQVQLTPALGLFPLNLSGVTSWSSAASASGNAAWNLSWSYVDHGWNGTTASHSGYVNGTWSKTTEVVLAGHVAGTYAKWVDHRLRTAIALRLTGPFDLYAGVLLIPHPFDLFGGGVTAYAGSGVGATAITEENLFVIGGPQALSAGSVTAANMTAATATPSTVVTGTGGGPAATTPGGSPDPTVWEQPESPAAAQSQANCLQFGCSASTNPFAGLVLPLVLVGVAAVVAIGLILSRRGRGGRRADVPLSAQPPATGPTPPTGVPSAGDVRPPL